MASLPDCRSIVAQYPLNSVAASEMEINVTLPSVMPCLPCLLLFHAMISEKHGMILENHGILLENHGILLQNHGMFFQNHGILLEDHGMIMSNDHNPHQLQTAVKIL